MLYCDQQIPDWEVTGAASVLEATLIGIWEVNKLMIVASILKFCKGMYTLPTANLSSWLYTYSWSEYVHIVLQAAVAITYNNT